MKLNMGVENYVGHKRGLGMRFNTEASILKAFCKTIGNMPMRNLCPDQVQAFLMVNGQWTRTSEIRYAVLSGFYRFAVARNYTKCVPLPSCVAKRPQVLVPYIYTRQELVRLFEIAGAPFPA